MEKYRTIETIGKGSFGEVTKAQNMETGEIVAIKKMMKKFSTWEECMSLRELKPLRKLQHKNIVKLKEVLRVHNELSFVFEHVEQDIFKLYDAQKQRGMKLPEPIVRSIFYQLAQSLAYMHKHGYFHRDLKPENILFSSGNNNNNNNSSSSSSSHSNPSKEGVLKLIDFGLAREIRSRPPYTEYVATRWYRAPELLLHSSNYNSPVDIFALGCIMAELFMSKPLFSGSSELDQLAKITSVLGTPSKHEWPEGHRLASVMKATFPSFSSIPLQQVLGSDIPHDAVQLIAECLRWDPAKRPTAQKILQHPYFYSVEEVLPTNYMRDIDEQQIQTSSSQPQQQQQLQQLQQQQEQRQTNQQQTSLFEGKRDFNNNNNRNSNKNNDDDYDFTFERNGHNPINKKNSSSNLNEDIYSTKPPLPFSQRNNHQSNSETTTYQYGIDRSSKQNLQQPRESGVSSYSDFLVEKPLRTSINNTTSNATSNNNNNNSISNRQAPMFDENMSDLFAGLQVQKQPGTSSAATFANNQTTTTTITSATTTSELLSEYASTQVARSRARLQPATTISTTLHDEKTQMGGVPLMPSTKMSNMNSYGGLPLHPRSNQQVTSATEKRSYSGFESASSSNNINNRTTMDQNNQQTSSIPTNSKNPSDPFGFGIRPPRNLNSAVISGKEKTYFSNEFSLPSQQQATMSQQYSSNILPKLSQQQHSSQQDYCSSSGSLGTALMNPQGRNYYSTSNHTNSSSNSSTYLHQQYSSSMATPKTLETNLGMNHKNSNSRLNHSLSNNHMNNNNNNQAASYGSSGTTSGTSNLKPYDTAGTDSLRNLYSNSTYEAASSNNQEFQQQKTNNLYDFNHVRQPMRSFAGQPVVAPAYGGGGIKY